MRLKISKARLIASMLVVAAMTYASVGTLVYAQGQKQQGQAPAQAPATPVADANEDAREFDGNQATFALNQLLNSFDYYHIDREVKGSAKLSGSMTMVNLGSKWAEHFINFHPEVQFTRGPDGTDAGLRALEQDGSLIVGVSRPITQDEVARLKAGACKEPLSVVVALDPLAVYVNEANPIQALTPEQLEAMLRASGQTKPHASTWGELGVQGELASQKIQFHSRSELSGTKTYLKNFILRGDNVTKEFQSYRSSDEICNAIANDPAGFGICGFTETRPGIRTVPLALRGHIVPATEESFYTGRYPLVRPLILVFDKSQMKTDGGLRESMLRYILSRDGQMEAVKAGFCPLDPSFVRKQLDEICGPRMR